MTIEQLYHELTEAEALERDAILMKMDAEMNLRQSRQRVADILAKIDQTMKDEEYGDLYQFADGNSVVEFYYTKPGKVVDFPDTEAIPDEFVKIERVPKKKEIAELLKTGEQVNWAVWKEGASNLTYRLKKR